jgi:hypothetical protein
MSLRRTGILRRETSPARGQAEPSSAGAPHTQSEPRCEQAIPGRVCGARGREPGCGARARALTAGMTVQAAAGAGSSAQASSTPAPAARHDFPPRLCRGIPPRARAPCSGCVASLVLHFLLDQEVKKKKGVIG